MESLSLLSVYKPLDIAYATAAKGQAIGHATAEKAYWLGFYDAGEPANDPVLIGTRDVAKADSDVAQVDALGIADEAWTAGYVAADRVYRTDRAGGVQNWQTAQAAIDRDVAIATAPLEETLTLAYLAAQTAYWTAEVAAASARRTAEAGSLADWRDDDYAGKTAAAAGVDTAMSLPWTKYQADKAAALENWWTTDERANFLALAAATNTAETAYQTTVNTAYTAWATATAGAEKSFAIADAGNQYDWIVADLAAEAAYEQALALADEAWQIERADAKHAFDLAKKTNWRNFVEDADLTARQTADALAASIQAGENQENDQTYTIEESEAAGIRKLAKATSWRDYVADFNTAVVPYVAATSGADETYAVAEATAHATRAIAIAEAMRDRDLDAADSLASALDALALASTSPWADYDAALADADDTFTAAVAPALTANLTAHANAELTFTTSQAAAAETLDNALTTASTTHRLSLANADRDRAITEVLAENNAAQSVPINNLASMTGRAVASATGGTPPAQGDQPATSPDGRPTTPPKVYGPELPPPVVRPAPTGTTAVTSTIAHPIPKLITLPEDASTQIHSRPSESTATEIPLRLQWPFPQMPVAETPIVGANDIVDTTVVVIIVLATQAPGDLTVNVNWTKEDIEREASRRASDGQAVVWTTALEREKQRWIELIEVEIAQQRQAEAIERIKRPPYTVAARNGAIVLSIDGAEYDLTEHGMTAQEFVTRYYEFDLGDRRAYRDVFSINAKTARMMDSWAMGPSDSEVYKELQARTPIPLPWVEAALPVIVRIDGGFRVVGAVSVAIPSGGLILVGNVPGVAVGSLGIAWSIDQGQAGFRQMIYGEGVQTTGGYLIEEALGPGLAGDIGELAYDIGPPIIIGFAPRFTAPRGGFAMPGGAPSGSFGRSAIVLDEVLEVAQSRIFIERARRLGFSQPVIDALPARIRQYGGSVGERMFGGWAGDGQFIVGRISVLSTRNQRIMHELGHVLDDLANPGLFKRSTQPGFGWSGYYRAERIAYTMQYGVNPVPLTAFNATAQAYPVTTRVVVYSVVIYSGYRVYYTVFHE